ncbi:flippase-like domain-containing protein [Pediococcus ethanolidurans]|uniref:lysylphosphatidylglycerol synthase transmembrane domain-containing protein n=1 Tax=Pediococcus ethanolidurans TaxID=319653 RepID=UPI001C1E8E83|nr:lysylphosphatidylglycerol synthase transmembrane domain-containing protein [Pediococcus ethanolidurans]MBU7555655.1 flippase-like domain-containing protein [Pediococcus ethanolidurans]MBU7563613.1 flippase-like domain-containing protein [Pediococcus ethanolidurans]MCV3316183.1 flippase-like domain-containing protein [Pediococcus ethanolidurans]MCV3322179.1 flippase-like domain-containing protein [Pediococcus ethanolidurans]
MSKRNKIVLVIMLALGVGIFAFSLRNVNLNQLLHDIVHIHVQWLLVAVICMLLYFGIEAVITKMFVVSNGDRFSIRDAIRIPLIEQLFNGITPFSSGGQPAQLVALMQSGVEAGRASSVLLMKFVVFQAMIVINFMFSLLIGFNYIAEKMSYLSLFVVFGFLIHFAVIIGLLLVMYWHGFTKKLISWIMIPIGWFVKKDRYDKWKVSLDEKVDTFYLESVRIKLQWKLLIKVFVMTFFQLLFYYLVPYYIMLSLGYTGINIIMVTSLHVLIVMVISIFPIPGGSGGAEYSFDVLFSSFIHSNSKLVLAMLIWRLLTYYFGMFGGMFALVTKPDKLNRTVVKKV